MRYVLAELTAAKAGIGQQASNMKDIRERSGQSHQKINCNKLK
jgi:hypothetical protein